MGLQWYILTLKIKLKLGALNIRDIFPVFVIKDNSVWITLKFDEKENKMVKNIELGQVAPVLLETPINKSEYKVYLSTIGK